MTALITDYAGRLGVEPAALRAVMRVECGTADPAKWVAPDGRAIVRLEAHHVLRRLGAPQDPTLLRIRDRAGHWYGGRGPSPARPWEGHEVWHDGRWADYHRQDRSPDGLPCEWDALDVAATLIGAEPAAACASWGPGQVLGSHAGSLGLRDALEVQALAGTAEGGIELVARYLDRVAPPALTALRARDWFEFAAIYNGPGKAADYAGRLAKAYRS